MLVLGPFNNGSSHSLEELMVQLQVSVVTGLTSMHQDITTLREQVIILITTNQAERREIYSLTTTI